MGSAKIADGEIPLNVGSKLSDLIERLEKATDGSRELDAHIECEVRRFQAYDVGLNDAQRAHWNPVGAKGEVIDTQGFTRYHAPRYSQSIDAAMTLLPDGVYWMAACGKRSVNEPLGACALYHPGVDQPFIQVEGHTVAIAFCIAALKAQLSTRTNEQDDARNLSGVSSE